MPIVPSPGDRVQSSLHRYTLLKLLNKGACANAFSATDERGEKVFLKAYTSPTTLKPWYDAYLRYEIELNARLAADPILAQQSVRALDAFSATFEHEGRLKRILEHLKKGDWVVIQFGHNDQKIKGEEPENGYTRRLNDWIDKISAKGAFVVLVTPVERRRFDEKTGEHQGKTLAGYAEAVKSVAAARSVPVIDLNDASYRMQGKMGAKGSAKLQCSNKGKIDNTHHHVYGAYEMARIVAAGLAEIPTVKDAIRDPYRSFNPENPDGDPRIPPSGKTDYTKPEGS